MLTMEDEDGDGDDWDDGCHGYDYDSSMSKRL